MTEQMEMLGRMVLMAGKLDKTAQMVQTAMILKIPTITYALFQTWECSPLEVAQCLGLPQALMTINYALFLVLITDADTGCRFVSRRQTS